MGVEIPTPQRILEARARELTKAINLLLIEGHTLAALILLYTSIDTFGSLLRPAHEIETKGAYFKQWADSYMAQLQQLGCSSEELWGARCGLLHTHTASSKLSHQGKVRQIHYSRGSVSPELKLHLDKQGKLFIDVDELANCFEKGIQNYFTAICHDSELKQRAYHHASKLFGHWHN